MDGAAFELISHLFRNHNRAEHVEQIAAQLALHPELVYIMCRHLELVELVVQEPPASRRFRYDVRSPNVEVQAKVEAALLDYQPRLDPPQAA